MQPIQKISYRHEEVLMWLMLNPDKPQGKCAEELNYTQSWISQIVNSDLFKARLAELRAQDFNVSVLSIREKLNAVASMSLDKQLEKMELEQSFELIQKAGTSALKSLGYGTAAPVGKTPDVVLNQQNNFHLGEASKETLAQAREMLNFHKENTEPLTAEDDQERDQSGQVTIRSNSIEGFATRVEDEQQAT